MSSVWTKARKNTPEIDCGLCGFTTCGAFARSVVVGSVEISACPILGLERFRVEREELKTLSRDVKNTEKPAPEQPERGVLLSKPCTDSPDLLMAEMRIFNGVSPGDPMKYGVLDPSILCWFLDCVSSRYEDMRCSKELAYAWGNMEEIKVHILRDGRVRMRRARGADHALDSFKIIERTVMGAIICNCCGQDLLSVLAGLVKSTEEYHTVLRAGSTVFLNREFVQWIPSNQIPDIKPVAEMSNLIDELYSDMTKRVDQLISGNYSNERTNETRSKICKIISLMVDPLMRGNETIFLRGLALAFFIDNAVIGLNSLHQLSTEGQVDQKYVVKLMRITKNLDMQEYKPDTMNGSEILAFAHCNRVGRAFQLYDKWKRN
ncbi:MAG: (Fe-S)-binding protein [Candidatus Thorarchaeota archaeon SMTZ1-45]|nr:MAG: hypothetical protein AM325_00250 [Candidatus Thorarchaeota archaeon SMTZ1-45]